MADQLSRLGSVAPGQIAAAHQLVALSSNLEVSFLPILDCEGWRLKPLSSHPPRDPPGLEGHCFSFFSSFIEKFCFCSFFLKNHCVLTESNKRGEIKVLREASGGGGEGSARTKLIKLFIIAVLKLYWSWWNGSTHTCAHTRWKSQYRNESALRKREKTKQNKTKKVINYILVCRQHARPAAVCVTRSLSNANGEWRKYIILIRLSLDCWSCSFVTALHHW